MPADLLPALGLMGGVLIAMLIGLVLGLGVRHLLKRVTELGRLSDTVAFIGGALGILLGLMIVFAAQHYQHADESAENEAVASANLFHIMQPFAEPERSEARHLVVCLMRSTIADDWPAAQERNVSGSDVTNAWARDVLDKIEGLGKGSAARDQAYFFTLGAMLDRSAARQTRLLTAQPKIPMAVWAVIFISTLVFSALLAFQLADRLWLLTLALVCTGIVLLALTGTLALLDYPFGWGPSVNSDAMTSTLSRLQSMYGPAVFGPCGAPVPVN